MKGELKKEVRNVVKYIAAYFENVDWKFGGKHLRLKIQAKNDLWGIGRFTSVHYVHYAVFGEFQSKNTCSTQENNAGPQSASDKFLNKGKLLALWGWRTFTPIFICLVVIPKFYFV